MGESPGDRVKQSCGIKSGESMGLDADAYKAQYIRNGYPDKGIRARGSNNVHTMIVFPFTIFMGKCSGSAASMSLPASAIVIVFYKLQIHRP